VGISSARTTIARILRARSDLARTHTCLPIMARFLALAATLALAAADAVRDELDCKMR
jgi:hypothetical protein